MNDGRKSIRAPLAGLLFSLALGLACSQATESESDERGSPDVFVILVDTLRADALSTFNERLPIGDSIARLANDGIVLEQLRAPSSWTRSSVASLLTGLPIASHRVFGRLDVLSDRHETLAAALRSNGYRTQGWSTNPNIIALWGFGQGFDELHDMTVLQVGSRVMKSGEVVDRVMANIEVSEAEPLFHYIHVTDPHNPYQPNEADLAAVRALGERTLRENFPGNARTKRGRKLLEGDYPRYLGEVVAVDRALGRFFDFLRENGRYDDALIVLVSDHGEEFGDHGGVIHGRTLFDEVLRVPGIIKLPGNRHAGTRISQPSELIDLKPTLLSALAIEPAEETPVPKGQDLLAWIGSAPADSTPGDASVYALSLDSFRISGIRRDPYKLIYDHVNDRAYLYDLEQDPGERRNVAEARPEVASELERLLHLSQDLHSSGWHLRGCGCNASSPLAYVLRGSGDIEAGASLESSDAIRSDEAAGTWYVEISLDPEAIGLRIKPDEDEIRLSGATDWTVAGADRRPLDVAFGNGKVISRSDVLTLSELPDEVAVAPSEPVVCDPSGAAVWGRNTNPCRPHLRIWRRTEGEVRTSDEVDPAIRERLRALGYDW